jgi:AraC-like DNA-binding protein
MRFTQHDAGPRLKSVVKTIWRARGTRAEFSAPDPIAPDGCVEIVFNLGDPFVGEDGSPQPRVLLAGQMTRPVIALPAGDVDLLGIRFHTGRAGSVLRVSMRQLRDRLIDASSVIATLDGVADDLSNLPDDRRLSHLEHALSSHASRSPSTDIDRAVALIDASHGNASVKTIAQVTGLSRRHLERRFDDEVGLGVKQLSRIRRVHAAMRMMETRPVLSGAEIAVRCGYSDQAHLIRECRTLTGRTPAALLTTSRSLAGLMREAAAIRSA